MMMGPCLRLQLRQTIELAPTPPEAICGIDGMMVADEVLKKYKVAGMLVGGIAKEAWSGSSKPSDFSKHKDVDVLVLSRDCDKHPNQWEAGIDWWIRHKATERPTNGSDVGLVWRISFRRHVKVSPGLYLCPLELLKNSIRQERRVFGNEFRHNKKLGAIRFNKFPILSTEFFRVKWGDDCEDVADHCKVK